LSESDSSQREENRRSLVRLYSIYTIQYAAFAYVLAAAVVGELILLGSRAFPQFVVYPLIIVTVIPATMSFCLMIHWWRMRHYALSLLTSAVQGDSLAALRSAHKDYGDKRFPRFVVEIVEKMDRKRVALMLLVVFLLSLPLSYYAVSSRDLMIVIPVAAVSSVAGALVVLFIPPLASIREARRAMGRGADHKTESAGEGNNGRIMTAEVLNALSGQAEQLRLTANEQLQNQSVHRSQTRTRIDLGDLPDRIVAEINSLAASRGSLLSDQRENLTRVVSSLTSTVLALGQPVEAARIYSAYRMIIPE
jgi:hypothetical protein